MADPFAWLNYRVTSPFGDTDRIGGLRTKDSDHIDIGTPEGVPITSLNDGVVLETGNHPQFGNYVIVKKDDGNTARYFHGSAVNVKKGQRVARGDVVMTSGNTGASTGPHTSVTVFNPAGVPFDPLEYIRKLADSFGGTTMATGTKSPGSRGPTNAPQRDDPPPRSSRPGNAGENLGGMLNQGRRLQGQSGGVTPTPGVLTDPITGPGFWGNPANFFKELYETDRLGATRRAMARGGAPMYGGPDFLQNMAGKIATYNMLQQLGRGAGFEGLGPGGAFDPAMLMDLFAKLVSASGKTTSIDQVMARAGSTGEPTAAELAEADELEYGGGVAGGGKGRVQNIFSEMLRNPQLGQQLVRLVYGPEVGAYFGNLQNYYKDFELENMNAGVTNPVQLLAQMLGDFRGYEPGWGQAQLQGG